MTPLIVGDGTPEQRWRQWGPLAGFPPAPLPAGGRVVVVAAHPDDETLGAGGTMRRLCARGCSIQLVAATDGEASHPGSTEVAAPVLARRRRRELDAALAALGLGSVAVYRLALPDGELESRVAAVAAALSELLPGAAACLATWRHDAHPDHEAVGHAAAQACGGAGVPLFEYPVWLWHWAEPGDARVPWQQARCVRFDAATRAAKRRAVAAFVSQVAALGPGPADGPVLTNATLARYDRPFEVLFTASPRNGRRR